MSIETIVETVAIGSPAQLDLAREIIQCADCGDTLTWHSEHICQCMSCHQRRTQSNYQNGRNMLDHKIALTSLIKKTTTSAMSSTESLLYRQ